jgi:3-oxoacyl-[acyl-carrier protein] reductase
VKLALDGKSVLVGGSSRGIGLAIARAFLAEGAAVAISGRGDEQLEAARASLAAEFPEASVTAVTADLTTPDGAQRAVASAAAELAGLDVVVANSGTGKGDPADSVPPDEWRRLIDQNLMSAVALCDAAVPALSRGGAIALVGSIAGLTSLPAPLPYSAAKAALTRYTADLARRLGPAGIRVNMVAPGNVLFPGGRWEEKLAEDRAGVEAYVTGAVPLARFGTPEEIAAAVVFLCSDRAGFTTGACLVADGGQSL